MSHREYEALLLFFAIVFLYSWYRAIRIVKITHSNEGAALHLLQMMITATFFIGVTLLAIIVGWIPHYSLYIVLGLCGIAPIFPPTNIIFAVYETVVIDTVLRFFVPTPEERLANECVTYLFLLDNNKDRSQFDTAMKKLYSMKNNPNGFVDPKNHLYPPDLFENVNISKIADEYGILDIVLRFFHSAKADRDKSSLEIYRLAFIEPLENVNRTTN